MPSRSRGDGAFALPDHLARKLQSADEDVHAAAVARGHAAAQALGLEVVGVDLPRAEEQVVGVDATALVAAVAEDLALGNRAVRAGPRQAMGEPRAIAIARRAVALPLPRAVPDPAARERIAPAVVGDALGD